MKCYFLLIIAVLNPALSIIAQNLTPVADLRIYDESTGEPIAYANIYCLNNGVGASSDFAGHAMLKFNQTVKPTKEQVVISHVGYENDTVWVRLDRDTSIVINLQRRSSMLEEIVITTRQEPDANEIIKRAISTNSNYQENDHLIECIYREAIKEDDVYIQYNEALSKVYYTGYTKPSYDRKLWESWFYNARYAFDLRGNYFFYPLLKDQNLREDHQSLLAIRRSRSWSSYGVNPSAISDPLLMLTLDKIKYQYDFFDPSMSRKYSYSRWGTDTIDGEECYVIVFSPTDASSRFKIDQARKNRYPIYTGVVKVSKTDYSIKEFNYQLAVDRDFGFFSERMPLRFEVSVRYKRMGSKNYMNRISWTELKSLKVNNDSMQRVNLQLEKELIVINIDTINISPIPDSNRFYSTRYSSIRYSGGQCNSEQFKTIYKLNAIDLRQDVIEDLNSFQPIDEQFTSMCSEIDLAYPKIPRIYACLDRVESNLDLCDSLYWMALPEYKKDFINYLNQENEYADKLIARNEDYGAFLYSELKGFYRNNQTSPESVERERIGNYQLVSDSNDYLKIRTSSKSEIPLSKLDSVFEMGNMYLSKITPSPDGNLLALTYNSPQMLGSSCILFDPPSNTILFKSVGIYSHAWFDNNSMVFTTVDKVGRSHKAHLYKIDDQDEILFYVEEDSLFDLQVQSNNGHCFLITESKAENEIAEINLNENTVSLNKLISRGSQHVHQYASNSMHFFYSLKKRGIHKQPIKLIDLNMTIPYAEIKLPKGNHFIEEMIATERFLFVKIRSELTQKIIYMDISDINSSGWKEITVPSKSPTFLGLRTIKGSDSIAFTIATLDGIPKLYKYDPVSTKLREVKSIDILDKYGQSQINIRRVFVRGDDRAKIPLTIIGDRTATRKHNGLILQVYGAYGATLDPQFSAQYRILLKEGYTLAIAHVRGGGMKGQSWYENGKLLNKKNSINDFIACAEYLINKGYTTPDLLVAQGNSAGGLIVGAAINQRPELFSVAIFDHPYLDVLATMSLDTIPLTTDEYLEWGNPDSTKYYHYIKSYSPFQNIRDCDYPDLIFIVSIHDYQTPIWQSVGSFAKYRIHDTNLKRSVIIADLFGGHEGSRRDDDYIILYSKIYAFVDYCLRSK